VSFADSHGRRKVSFAVVLELCGRLTSLCRLAQVIRPIVISRAVASILRGQPGALASGTSSGGIFASWGRSSHAPAAASQDEKDAPDGGGLETLGSAEPSTSTGSANPKWLQRLTPRKAKPAYAERRGARAASTAGSSSAEASPRGSMDEPKPPQSATDPPTPTSAGAPTLTEEERDRAERRIRALSPLGSVDYVIPLQPTLLSHQYLVSFASPLSTGSLLTQRRRKCSTATQDSASRLASAA